MTESIKNFFRTIATLGGIGSWFFGVTLGSLLAFPIVIIGRGCNISWTATAYTTTLGILIIIIFGILQPEERPSIALSRVMGLAGALYKVSITTKKFTFIFILFTLLNFISAHFILPPLFRKLRGDSYDPSSLYKLLLSDALAAILTIGTYRLVMLFW